jgi:hypothetical protein
MAGSDPMPEPAWWPMFRRAATFLLGCAVIIDALLVQTVPSVGTLTIGLILVGVLPIDDLLRLARRGRGGGSDDG